MVLSPEHALLEKWMDRLGTPGEVQAYQAAAASKSDLERTELNKEKTGVKLEGVEAINPVNGKEIPHLHLGLRPLHLWNWCDHGGVRPMTPATGNSPRPSAAPIIEVVKGGNDGPRRPPSLKDDTGIHGQLRLPQRSDRQAGGHSGHHQVAGGKGHRPPEGQL